ncbi:Glutathione S-transferase [Diplonema papillatum]|nr:Glutathione S-transferase [Diplonema papillatum]
MPFEKPKSLRFFYFDLAGGGEPIRLAFRIGGVDFDDVRIPFDVWPNEKDKMPLGQVPVLEIDDRMYTQGLAQLRYAAAISGLCTQNPMLNLKIDECVYILQDLTAAIGRTLPMEPGERRSQIRRKWLVTDFPSYMMRIDNIVKEFGADITIADLLLYSRVMWWESGVVEDVPKECCTPYRSILKRVELVKSHPKVVEWNQSHNKHTTEEMRALTDMKIRTIFSKDK